MFNFDLSECGVENDPAKVKIYRNTSFKAIYSDRYGVNLKVSSLALIPEKRLMILGVRRIGLIFYNLDHLKILKIESLASRFIFGATNPSVLDIIEILPQNDRNFKLLTQRRGMIILTYPELTPETPKTIR